METSLIEEIASIWISGGLLMIPLAALGAMIYFSVVELYLYLAKNNYYKSDQNRWGHWVDVPADATGEVGEIIRFTQDDVDSIDEIRSRFEEIRTAHLPRLRSRILFSNIMIGAAPLTGLLGTVMGMLTTFSGMSVSTSGDTVDMVAGGISEALITTQTGLILAIPALVMLSSLKKQVNELEIFFTRLEILTIMRFERQQNLIKNKAV